MYNLVIAPLPKKFRNRRHAYDTDDSVGEKI